jgi:hypothetical protein
MGDCKGDTMKVQELLRQQLSGAHGILLKTMADVRPEDVQRTVEGATISSIGHIYTHLIHGEDGILHGMIRGQAPIWVTGGYAERSGIMPSQPGQPDAALYDRMAALDWSEIQAYAEATFAATDAYLANASDAEMERIIETGFMGAMPAAAIVGNILIWHTVNHNGEIAALKGVFGQKGLPF